MATIRSGIANTAGVRRGRPKSARTSARVFADALRGGDSRARTVFGLRSMKGRQATNLKRRKSLGGKGG